MSDAILGGILASLIAAAIVRAFLRLSGRRSKGRSSPVEHHTQTKSRKLTDPGRYPAVRVLAAANPRKLDVEGYPVDLHVYDELPPGPHVLLPYPRPMDAAHELTQIGAPRSREMYTRNTFIGRWVRWTGIVSNVSDEDGLYRVATRSAYGRSGGLVILMFPLTRRPEVEILRKGQEITYEGQIRRASEVGFSLVRVEILPIA